MNSCKPPLSCDYCGLPIAPGWLSKAARATATLGPSTPQYCCSGCRLAAEIARDRGDAAPTAMLTRLGIAIFLTMNVVCFSMALWSEDIYADGNPANSQISSVLADLFRYLSLLFSVPVVYLLSGPLMRNAWQQLRRGAAATDLLLVLGVGAAFAYSLVSLFRGAGHLYFEVGSVVLVFVTLGRWLETTGRQEAGAALDALAKLLPEEVRRIVKGIEETIPLESLVVGDRLRLLPGERVPTDGRIVAGQAAMDEQLVTGESQPSVKEPGDLVYGGTLNLDGQLTIEATAAANEGTLRRLVDAVAAARRTKGHYQRLADQVATWFLPLAALVAIAAALYHGYFSGFEAGLLTGMAVVLIACPCALGLATPLAVWSALGAAARSQIVFRHGEALERLANVRSIFFDKTGTLSCGEAHVNEFLATQIEGKDQVRQIARSLAVTSNHPLSRSICEFLDTDLPMLPLAVHSVAGRGVSGTDELVTEYFLGNLAWMKELHFEFPLDLQQLVARSQASAAAIVCVGWNGRVRGVFSFLESLRPEATSAIHSLHQMHLHLEILSGDYAARVRAIGSQLGIPAGAELLPEQKVSALSKLMSVMRPVAMVGDGINDAPALAAADIGIAMGCGADVSREAADVCLLSSNLHQLPTAIALSRRTVRIIRQNLFWTFAYNIVGIGLACTGKLNPMWAAAAMTVSSVLVVTNSLRLGRAIEMQGINSEMPSITNVDELSPSVMRAEIQESSQ